MVKPLLLVDVDGPLNPDPKPKGDGTHSAGDGWVAHQITPNNWGNRKPLQLLISQHVGQQLNELSKKFTLIWATTWEDEANEFIAPLLGTKNWPVINWPKDAHTYGSLGTHRGSWKTKHILTWLNTYAPQTPWAWVDDEINRVDRKYVKEYYGENPVAHKLIRVEEHIGLNTNHFDMLKKFADELQKETNT